MNTDTKPNPSDFSVNERKGEYFAYVEVTGRFRFTCKAESLEDAQKQLEAEIATFETEPFDIQLDEADEITATAVRSEAPMYRVWEDGQKLQVSRLTEKHTPRQPDERGF